MSWVVLLIVMERSESDDLAVFDIYGGSDGVAAEAGQAHPFVDGFTVAGGLCRLAFLGMSYLLRIFLLLNLKDATIAKSHHYNYGSYPLQY